jgi:hypothetical protein
MFLFLFLVLISTVYGYVGWRLIAPLEFGYPLQLLASLAILCLGLLPPAALLFRQRLQNKAWQDQFLWFTYLTMGYSILTSFMLLGRDLLGLAWDAARLALRFISQTAEAKVVGTAQPEVLLQGTGSNLIVLVAAGLTAIYGFYQARRRPRARELAIPIENLPAALKGFRIAQISDVHVGPTIKADFVRGIAETVQAAAPDLIVFTGDLADGDVARLGVHVQPLANLRAPHGCFFVTGNHEYYSGVKDWLAVIGELGFRALINEHVLIERGGSRIVLAGVTDDSAGAIEVGHASDPDRALSGAPAADLRILLAHQPRSAVAAASHGFDLQLSGHTHGGQFIPWHLFVMLLQPYMGGIYRRGSSWIYVNRGAGYWGPPLRLGAPSEIAVLTLTRAGR